mgnify:CR=1 FL=1
MSCKQCILVVEDDTSVLNFIRASLISNGYRVIEAKQGSEGLSLTASHIPDLIILDLGLPDIDGIEVLRRIREWSSIPIIVVSARGQESSKVEALNMGADDYLTKPFSVGELLARIRVAFRHLAMVKNRGKVQRSIIIRGFRIDLEKREISIDGRIVHLTPIEYKMVVFLAKHAGKVVTHSTILKEIWGPGSTEEKQYLRVFMANLRRKIEKDPSQPVYLKTEVGVGYRLIDE